MTDIKKFSPLTVPVPLPPEFQKNFLLIGDSGTGKTRFSGTFPRPYFVDTDMGTESIEGRVAHKTFIEISTPGRKPRHGQLEYGTAWPALIRHVDWIGEQIDKGTWPHDTIVFDSLTTLQEIALNHVLRTATSSNRYKAGDSVDPGLWSAQMMAIQGLVSEVRMWPGLKIFTAHIQKDTNSVTETIEKMALVTGKLAGKLPLYFDEIYFTEVQLGNSASGQTRNYVLRSFSDSVHRSARTRMDVPMNAKQDFKTSIWPPFVERVNKQLAGDA